MLAFVLASNRRLLHFHCPLCLLRPGVLGLPLQTLPQWQKAAYKPPLYTSSVDLVCAAFKSAINGLANLLARAGRRTANGQITFIGGYVGLWKGLRAYGTHTRSIQLDQ